MWFPKQKGRLLSRPFQFIACGSSLDQRALGRPLRAAGASGLGLARRALAGSRELLLLRRDRTLDELEADLVLGLVGLVLDQNDADMAATLELAEQHLVGQRLLDMLLDHASHR